MARDRTPVARLAVAAGQEVPDVGDHLVERPLPGFPGGPRDVWRNDQVRQAGLEQQMARCRRLLREHVDGGATE